MAGAPPSLNKIDPLHEKLMVLHQALGIAPDYLDTCKMPLCSEANRLIDTELDYYQRPQRLMPEAFQAWSAMKQAAATQQISIFLISAFRDYQYQHDVIARKLAEGRSITEILSVNAAPGFSEHHTGCAIDIGTDGCEALVENFENTKAFQWLTENAANYCFRMTYPRNNSYEMAYEPWHWCFAEGKS